LNENDKGKEEPNQGKFGGSERLPKTIKMNLCYTYLFQKSAGLMNQAPTKKGMFDKSNTCTR